MEIIPDLKRKVYFKRLNFMDKFYPIQGQFDVVFCRNVLIYFERHVQEQVINKICKFIPTGGYFFLGHSESILGMNVPLVQMNALMGFVADAVNATILGLEIPDDAKGAAIRSFSKLLWIQNDLINRHYAAGA